MARRTPRPEATREKTLTPLIARVHERIGFRRDTFTYQESRQIIDRFGVICVAKSIQDAAWSGFLEQVSSKAEEAGRHVIKVNAAYTSQDCSRNPVWVTGNHHRQKRPLSERTSYCPCCLLVIDRDLNAALNIKAVGLHRVGVPLEAPAFRPVLNLHFTSRLCETAFQANEYGRVFHTLCDLAPLYKWPTKDVGKNQAFRHGE